MTGSHTKPCRMSGVQALKRRILFGPPATSISTMSVFQTISCFRPSGSISVTLRNLRRYCVACSPEPACSMSRRFGFHSRHTLASLTRSASNSMRSSSTCSRYFRSPCSPQTSIAVGSFVSLSRFAGSTLTITRSHRRRTAAGCSSYRLNHARSSSRPPAGRGIPLCCPYHSWGLRSISPCFVARNCGTLSEYGHRMSPTLRVQIEPSSSSKLFSSLSSSTIDGMTMTSKGPSCAYSLRMWPIGSSSR